MREIKFRGKSSNGWYYGYLTTDAYDIMFIESSSGTHLYTNRVIKETVGQYTGLKDKNGKEIYEGDILKYSSDGYLFDKGDVIFSDGSFRCRGTLFRSLSSVVCPLFEIISNIYQNPELLENFRH